MILDKTFPQEAETSGASIGLSQPPRVESTTLFGSSRELIIVHNSREYRLRLTQNGKLILTA